MAWFFEIKAINFHPEFQGLALK